MSAIAAVLAAMGHHTTGSDIKPSRSLEHLRACGVEVRIGHRPENVVGADALTYSTAVSERNVEIAQARRLGIPVLSRAAMLEAIVALRRTVAVAGTHGKTTTSSMLALVLVEAGLHPSFIIGGEVNEIGTNAAWDVGELLVVEADESDGTFLHMAPELGIVTSVEPDHLEHYGSFEELKAAFRVFLGQLGSAIVCADDPVAACLAPASAVTYGCSAGAEVRIVGVESGRNHLRFELLRSGESIGVFELPVPGVHNAAQRGCRRVGCSRARGRPGTCPAGARPLCRCRTALRVPRRHRRCHLRRRLRPSARRGPRRAGRSPRWRLRADRVRLPAPSLLAGRDVGA